MTGDDGVPPSTDTAARVLDVADRPIGGLYSGGNPIGASLLFSHHAAMHMAAKR